MGKMDQNWLFFNLLKDLFIIFFLDFVYNESLYIIGYIPVQIPYLGKIWFQRYGPKCPTPINLQDFWVKLY